jgi:NitT/TauT family transport system permease protein
VAGLTRSRSRISRLLDLAWNACVGAGTAWIISLVVLAERVQPLAQFLAAFPANLLFPIFVIPIVRFGLNVDIFLTPLMILGTQW